MLEIKNKKDCGWDFVSLGEILLRFDPENERIHNARSFRVFDGGAEYNVARNLAKIFRCETVIVTALADNSLGRLAEDFAQSAGVDISQIVWRKHDGIGVNTRNGLYFIERGFGLRAPDSCFDRGKTAVSQLKVGDIDWRKIFGEKKTRWFHTGGVFTGLSETTPQVALEACKIAKENGAIVSYDLNYRASLWKSRGGKEVANELNREFLPFADVVFGVISNDFVPSVAEFDRGKFQKAAKKMRADFPNLQIIVSTLRDVHNASSHNFGAACYTDDKIIVADKYIQTNVLDRVGSGDAFVSGFIYSLLIEKDIDFAANFGAAHGVLAMTNVGDGSTATVEEIEYLMRGESSAAKR
ncbi:MAG: sugar kinase [Acidobacteriota bacterium]|nr:sugar kinase [Acidobacteriota bacterium]